MEEYIKKAKELFKQKKYQAAHQLCIQIINADPENSAVLRLKHKIEQEVEKRNIALIEKDLDTLKPLWKEEKYEEILLKLQDLYNFAPHYGRLKELILKADELLEKQKVEQNEQFIQDSLKEIKNLTKEKKFQEAIKKEEMLNQYLPTHPRLKKAFLNARRAYVKHLLKEKKEFLYSNMHKEILEFLQELQHIDPFYSKIPKLIKTHQNQYYSEQSIQKKEYIFQGVENIKTLYQKGKYDKTIKAAKEVLQADKSNKQAQMFFNKALKHQESIMTEEISQQIKLQYQENYAKYLENKKAFIRL